MKYTTRRTGTTKIKYIAPKGARDASRAPFACFFYTTPLHSTPQQQRKGFETHVGIEPSNRTLSTQLCKIFQLRIKYICRSHPLHKEGQGFSGCHGQADLQTHWKGYHVSHVS